MKIVINYDSVSKELEIYKDGVEVEDVCSLEFYPSYDGEEKFRMVLCQEKASSDNSYTQRLTTMAKLLGFETDEN
jgi:hypothetical protein